MNAIEFLAYLRELDIAVYADGDRLRVDGPKDALTPALRERLVSSKHELLELLRQARTGSRGHIPTIRPVPRGGPLPVSPAQQSLWLLDQLAPDSAAYVIPSALRLVGELDTRALEAAITEIVRRHESLRTVIEAQDGVPYQVVRAPHAIDLPVLDLRELPPEERLRRAESLAAQNARQPFDLTQGPLFRARLLRLDDAEHVLLIAVHHIVFDGWSGTIFMRELVTLYRAYRSGEPLPLPEPIVQYADFAHWRRQTLDDGGRDQHLAYWLEQLQGDLDPLDLPCDRPRGEAAGGQGASCSLELPRDLVTALEKLSHEEGATLAMTLLAAFQLLLHRLSGREDVRVGMPVAGRNHSEIENVIGFFINTVVMRASFAPALTFRELLRRVRRTALDAYAHQDMPFEELVTALHPVRDARRTPLFQVFFNHLNMEFPTLDIEGLEVSLFGDPPLESKFDVTLYVRQEGERLELLLAYDPALFDAVRAEEMLAQYRLTLESMTADPDAAVDDYPLVTARARSVVADPTVELRPADAAETLAVRDLGAWGERTAVVSDRVQWSYADLDALANGVAQSLAASGLRSGEVVAILADRDPWLVCALLGVLRAGGAFTILDSAYPDALLAERWRAAAPRGFLRVGGAMPRAGGELEATVLSAALRFTLPLGESSSDGEARGAASGLPAPDPADLAYLAFTSGTTGGVKAIAGAHGPVAHFLAWQRRVFGLGSDDRFLLVSGLSHDPLLRDVFAPLWAGATLCVPDRETREEPARLAEWMRVHGVTVAHLTPAMAQFLCAGAGPEGLPSLRYAFLGGDVLRADVVRRLRAAAPRVKCVNFYGATETPQAMSYHVVEPNHTSLRDRVPLGKGIDAVQLLVLTAAGRLAGIGELGEIAVRTPFLTLGYVGEPALTRERFTPNPFTGREEDRLYRSGDFGRYLPDGTVEFAGRRDGQAKLRGYRIELGAVETLLRRHPAVADAAVIVREDARGEQQLVAYVVGAADERPSAGALRESLERRLPAHSVPSAYVMLDVLPLTPNGKLDVRALPAPATDGRSGALPQTPTEELVAGVYAEVLNRAAVGRHEDFFELGGHSLLAAQVVARLQQRLGARVTLRALFEAPAPAALAARVDALLRGAAGRPPPPLGKRDRTVLPPLSFSQQRLWFIQELAPDGPAYNLAGAVEMRGRLDVAALRGALDAIARRHETLRTTIVQQDGRPVQLIGDPPANPLEIVELADGDDVLESLLRERTATPFDLQRGPLWRATLFRLGAERHALLVTCHHIVSDGWSMGVFLRELGVLYEALATDSEPELPALPVQYADFAVWQREWLQGEELARQLEYWRRSLAGAPGHLDLPSDRPRPPIVSYRGARYSFTLPSVQHDALRALSHEAGVTLFMTLLATFQLLLARYSGHTDVVVGTPVANRTRPELEPLIGFFVNTLVLRTDIARSRTFRALLASARDVCLGAYAHQDMPFEKLVEELKPPRDTSRNPLFQVMFVLQNMPLPALELQGLSIAPLAIERVTAQVDLTLYVWEKADGLECTFEYSTDLFDPQTVEQLARHWSELLRGATAAPDADLATLPMMNADERRALASWNEAARRERPPGETVLDLLAVQVARRPSAVAARCGSRELDYAELDATSNRLARHLQAHGVRPGVMVGLCIERGIDMIVAVLGILKAGGAYMPLDPGFPPQRLAFMLEDSGAQVLLTQSSFASFAKHLELSLVCLDDDRAAIEAQDSAPVRAGVQAAGRAYVIYTSGSTGKPKGVEISHAALSNFLRSMAREPGLAEDDVLVAVTTISFDISILELLLPLCVGARVVIADDEAMSDGRELRGLLESSGATVMQATPSLWRVLVEAGWRGSERFKALCGGEPFPPDLAATLHARCAEVWNMYGPTETTIWSTCGRITDPSGPISIGGPIENTRVYVLDEHLNPVPPLVPGELFIAGDGVAIGYLNRPELTAERFLPDPFEGDSTARMYRTGDQVRLLRDGRLQHLGRLDGQVKVRGYRIELGEIEASLARYPDVQECAVTVWHAGPADQRLVAHVVPRGGAFSAADLRKHLRSGLPDYMVPQHFVTVQALPRTPNGKLDRKALAPPAIGASGATGSEEPPRGETERAIADVWKAVIGCANVSRTDNFFDLGGHSLLAIQAIAMIEAKTGWRPNPRLLILENLQEIAVQCEQAVEKSAGEDKGLLSRLRQFVGVSD